MPLRAAAPHTMPTDSRKSNVANMRLPTTGLLTTTEIKLSQTEEQCLLGGIIRDVCNTRREERVAAAFARSPRN